MKKVEVNALVLYSNHTVKDSGIVYLSLKANYSQLKNIILCSQLLNEDISLKGKIQSSIIDLGIFRLKKIIIDSDGESKLSFMSNSDSVNLDSLNKIAINTQEVEEFKIKFSANVIEEE